MILARTWMVQVLLLVLTLPGSSWAAETSPTAPPPVSFSILRVIGSMALVFAIFLGGIWLFRNWQRLLTQRSGRPNKLHILEMRTLGGRQALYVVGYEHQRLLVASSQAGISLISHLPASENSSEFEAAPAAAPPFVDALRQALGKK